jgi:predicted DNA-binding protein with PD1-like motif
MFARKMSNRYLLRLETGEEVLSTLKAFSGREGFASASLIGLGAVDRLVVAYYDLAAREYVPRTYTGKLELLNLTGNIVRRESEHVLHIHATASREHEGAIGGHLVEARVGPTVEITLDLLDERVERKLDADIGLPLLDLPRYDLS